MANDGNDGEESGNLDDPPPAPDIETQTPEVDLALNTMDNSKVEHKSDSGDKDD